MTLAVFEAFVIRLSISDNSVVGNILTMRTSNPFSKGLATVSAEIGFVGSGDRRAIDDANKAACRIKGKWQGRRRCRFTNHMKL